MLLPQVVVPSVTPVLVEFMSIRICGAAEQVKQAFSDSWFCGVVCACDASEICDITTASDPRSCWSDGVLHRSLGKLGGTGNPRDPSRSQETRHSPHPAAIPAHRKVPAVRAEHELALTLTRLADDVNVNKHFHAGLLLRYFRRCLCEPSETPARTTPRGAGQ